MNYNNLGKKQKMVYWFVSLALFMVTVGTIWYVNHIIPFMMDDDWYATLLYSDEKIKNLLDIFKAQKWHYMNWGGRSVTHTILQLLLLSGETVADVINTVMVIVTGLIVTGLTETMTRIKRSIPEKILCTTIVMGMMLGLSANWEMSMFWQAGACNYLYITVFILLFIWVYMREVPYDCFGSKEPLWGINVWIIPLALIAGWSNENMGPVVFIFSIVTIVYVNKVEHVVQPWMILGSVFSFIGAAVCILAPGNFVRSATIENEGLLRTIYARLANEGKTSLEYLIVLLIIIVMSIAICKGVYNIPIGREAIYVLFMALLSWGAMVLSPHYPDRATYGTMIFLIIAIIAIWQKIFEKKIILKEYTYIGSGIIWLRGMFFLITFIFDYIGITY